MCKYVGYAFPQVEQKYAKPFWKRNNAIPFARYCKQIKSAVVYFAKKNFS